MRRDSAIQRRDTIPRPTPDSAVVAIPAPADSAAADSAARARQRDSASRRERPPADTIQAPMARAEVPVDTELGGALRWDRESMFASGAVTLLDLLERVPALHGFRAGWVATPHAAAYLGDFRAVRVFLDGMEWEPLDLRSGGVKDLAFIPLWTLEEVVLERGAGELRIHLRSWRVARTTPYTRADISTGDLETNRYRGFYGRRFGNGGALQIGAQQVSTADPRLGGDGTEVGLFGRTGWARAGWSADVLFSRTRRTRNRLGRRVLGESEFGGELVAFDASRTDAYFRVGYGDPAGGAWAQALAGTQRLDPSENLEGADDGEGDGDDDDDVVVPADSNVTRAHYLLAGGWSSGGLRISGSARMRSFDQQQFVSPGGRVAFQRGPLALSAYGERTADDSTTRADVSARFTALSFLSVGGSVGRISPDDETLRPAQLAMRGEVSLRVGRMWVTGGVLRRDTAVVAAARLFDTAAVGAVIGPSTATYALVSGRFWKDVGLEVAATRWDVGTSYRPQIDTRAEAFVRTAWLSRFPGGNFHFTLALRHEYRSRTPFPSSIAEEENEFAEAPAYQTLSSLLEIRLYDAVLFWQFRNALARPYQQVPGFDLPRGLNIYGVRWDFFN